MGNTQQMLSTTKYSISELKIYKIINKSRTQEFLFSTHIQVTQKALYFIVVIPTHIQVTQKAVRNTLFYTFDFLFSFHAGMCKNGRAHHQAPVHLFPNGPEMVSANYVF